MCILSPTFYLLLCRFKFLTCIISFLSKKLLTCLVRQFYCWWIASVLLIWESLYLLHIWRRVSMAIDFYIGIGFCLFFFQHWNTSLLVFGEKFFTFHYFLSLFSTNVYFLWLLLRISLCAFFCFCFCLFVFCSFEMYVCKE